MPPVSSDQGMSESERQRSRQLPIPVPAALTVAGDSQFSCEIAELGDSGALLRLTGGSKALKAGSQWIGRRIDLRFVASRRPDRPTLRLAGKILRVDQAGLTVAFDRPGASEALQALHEMARAAEAIPQRAHPSALEQACREALDSIVPEIMRQFFERIPTDLLDAADRAESTLHRTAFYDAVTIFRNSPEIAERFRAEVLRQAECHVSSGGAEPADSNADGLALVDTECYEDWLSLIGEAARLEAAFAEPLRIIDQRLLPSSTATSDPNTNPYGPLAFGRAFRKVTADLPLTNAAKSVAYKTLGRALSNNAAPFYGQLVELTASLDSPTPPKPVRETARPDLETRQSAGGASPDPSRIGLDPTPAGPAAPTASAGPAASGRSPGVAGAGFPSLSAAFAALSRLNAAPDATRAASGPKQPHWALPQGFISKLLNSRLREPQVNALGFLGAVMSSISADPATPAELRPILKQWQRPLFNLATRDPQLLDDPKSPARRLLDTLDQMSLAADSDGRIGDGLALRLDEWTERIATESARDPGVVERAAADLEALTEPALRARNLRVQRLRENCEGQRRTERTRQRVNAEVHRRLAGTTIPKIVAGLLENGWRDWLVQAYLRGENALESQESLEVLDNLLRWLGPAGRLPDKSTAYRLIELVEDRLYPHSLDPAACRDLIDELTALLIHRKKPDWIEWTGETPGETPLSPSQGRDPRILARLRSFRVGDWLRIAIEPDATPVPLSIAWIDDDLERFVFIDRQGNKRLELDSGTFSRYLGDRRATRAEGLELPLSERVVGTLMQNAQDNLRYHAYFDPITGLLNQKGLTGRLAQAFAERTDVSAANSLCILEIDQFRSISGFCGPEGSERLLGEIAEILKQHLGREESMARIGDNRFAALHICCELEPFRRKTEQAIGAIASYRFHWEDRSFAVSAYAGLVGFIIDAATPASVMKHADTACLRAKEKGIGQIQVYNEDDPSLTQREHLMDWGGRIDSILSEQRLCTRCQKIAPTNDVCGPDTHYEILLGIRDADGRLLPPGDFLAAAERWNRISDIDRIQIASVFAWIRRDPARFAGMGGFSINLSGQSVNSEKFMDFLHGQLSMADWPLEKITFEITETAAISEFGLAQNFIRKIRRLGCRFALDDFGSGFASYAYLKNLRVDFLKIDGAFVRDLASSDADYAFVKSMNEVGHSLGIKTVAEYVESEEIFLKLKEIGVDYVQGYHIGKPTLLNDLTL